MATSSRRPLLLSAVAAAFLTAALAAPAPGEQAPDDLAVGKAEETPATDLVGSALPDTQEMLARSLGALAAIGVVCLGLWLLARRLAARRDGRLKPNRAMRIVDRLSLGPRKSLCVVRVASSLLLLGLCDKGIQLLMEMPDEDGGRFAQALAEQAGKGESAPRDGRSERVEVSA